MGFVPALADGVYYTRKAPGPVVSTGALSSTTVMICTGAKGKINYPYPISTTGDLYSAIGKVSDNPYDGPLHGTLYIKACESMGRKAKLFAIRVSDGTDTAATLTIKDTAGTPGDVLKLVGAFTGSGLNGAAAKLTLVPGFATGQNVYNLQITLPDGPPENYANLVAYSGGTPSYSATTLLASAIAAVNGVSKNFIVVAPATQSTAAPSVTAAFAASGGTDGAAVSTSALIGTDGSSNRTGLWQGRNLKAAQVFIAGLTDFTVGPILASFAQSENSLAVGPCVAYGQALATTDSITLKQTNNITSFFSVPTLDWLYYPDNSGTSVKNRWVPNTAVIAGIIASRSPEESPSNQPEGGLPFISATERGSSPRAGLEADLATQAGYTWVGPLARNGALLGLVNGQNASPVLGQDGINFTRLTNIFAQELPSVLGYLVGQLQGTDKDDDARRSARKSCYSYLNQFNVDQVAVKCDLENNSLESIAAGNLIVEVWVRTKAAIRYIRLNVQAGVNVTVTNTTITRVS